MHTRRSNRCKPPMSHEIDRLDLGSAFVRSAKRTRSNNIPDPNPMPIKDGLSTFSIVCGSTGYMVANPARGQLNRDLCIFIYFFCPCSRLRINLARQVRPSGPASACSFSTLKLNVVLTHGIPRAFRDGVHIHHQRPTGQSPSLSGHAIAYRWRALPRVRRQRARGPQDSSSNGCCLFRFTPWTN